MIIIYKVFFELNGAAKIKSASSDPLPIKKALQNFLQGPSMSKLRTRRQRERRNRRKNLWGNVSLLRGWQQHLDKDVVNPIIAKIIVLIHNEQIFNRDICYFL